MRSTLLQSPRAVKFKNLKQYINANYNLCKAECNGQVVFKIAVQYLYTSDEKEASSENITAHVQYSGLGS